MTLEAYYNNKLVENGMWHGQAVEVIKLAKTDMPELKDRWNDDISGYPKEFLSVTWFAIKRYALQWIDKNLPSAFYRQMFV